MDKDYYIIGLHCESCSENLEEALKKHFPGKINYDLVSGKITINNDVDYNKVKILAQSYGAYLVKKKPSKKKLKEDSHDHNHQHGHEHCHHKHIEDSSNRNIGIAFFLNLVFSISEFIFGSIFNSYAIMSDAVHDLGDALSIGVAWGLQKVSDKEPDLKYTDGYGRFSLLGSLVTGLVLFTGSIMMIIRSIPRLINPEVVNYQGMFFMAIIATIINLYAWHLMAKGSSKNEKMLSFHMLEDVLGWIAVLVVSSVLKFVDLYILDPILSIIIASFILYKAVPELIDSIKIFMNVSPQNLNIAKFQEKILSLDHVHHISNLHFHSIDGQNNHFSIILYVDTKSLEKIEEIKDTVRQYLSDKNVSSSVIEVVADTEKIAYQGKSSGKPIYF